MYRVLKFRLTGEAPLIPHSGQGQDRKLEINQRRAQIHANRHKVEADFDELEKLDFLIGLYVDADGEPCIPGENIEGCMFGKSGAASYTKGVTRKAAAAAIFCDGSYKLEYEGPRDPKALQKLADFNFRCKAVRSGVSNYIVRPIFHEWSTIVEIKYNDDLIDSGDVVRLLEYAGENVGLMDWRPKYGRFQSELLDG